MLDAEVREKFKIFQETEEGRKYRDLDIDDVRFEEISLANNKYFEFIKGKNKYIQRYIKVNEGDYPILGSSLKNSCISAYIKPIDNGDIVNQKCVSFNKDNAKGSVPFYRDYPFLMDRHHIAIIPIVELVDAKYLEKSLIYFFENKKFGWGDNVADVPAIQKHSVPIPKDLDETYTSFKIQEAIVAFLEFWKDGYTDAVRERVSKKKPIYEAIKRIVVQNTFKYDEFLVSSFSHFVKDKGYDLSLDEIKFNSEDITKYINMVRGKVISKRDLIEDGKYPVYSSQTKNHGLFGYIDAYMFDGNAITWTTDGKHAGTTFLRSGKFNYTNVCGLMTVKDSDLLDINYLSYIVNIIFPKHVDRTSQNSKLMTHHIENIEIFFPMHNDYLSKEIQQLLVEFWETIIGQIENKLKVYKRMLELTDIVDKAFLYRTFSKIDWSKE